MFWYVIGFLRLCRPRCCRCGSMPARSVCRKTIPRNRIMKGVWAWGAKLKNKIRIRTKNGNKDNKCRLKGFQTAFALERI
ncbi:Uncharacterised protein [Neisseria meningitidis]|nr:Uncharacterised protein [Neisseria meningitidis]